MGSTCTCFNSTDKSTNETNIFTNNLRKKINWYNINIIKFKEQKINNNPISLGKLIKIQTLIRGRLIRKKYAIKNTYRTKETESYFYNFRDNNSDKRSINIGSDMINSGGFISNGATLNKNRNQKSLNLNRALKQTSAESAEKIKIDLQNIVRKK